MSNKRDEARIRQVEAGLSNVSGAVYEDVEGRFRLQAAAFEGAVAAMGDPAQASLSMLFEVLTLYGHVMDGVRTLRTIARSHLALNASDGNANAARSRIARRERELDERASPLLNALLEISEQEVPKKHLRAFRAWVLLAQVRRKPVAAGARKSASDFVEALSSDVFEPLLSLHTHLTSSMSIEVVTAEGAVREQSFGTSVAVLKSSDDPILRRSTFDGMSSWMAAHASSFADLLNVVAGFRLKRAEYAAGEDALHALYADAFRNERTHVEVFYAMTNAIDEVLERLREAVRLRADALGSGPMRVAHLLCPRPAERYSRGLTYEAMREDWRRAFDPVAPDFAAFVEEAHEAGWVNSQSVSMKAGGGWCDDLPVLNAVRIVATFFQNRAGEAQVTHLLGVGWLHQVLHGATAPERRVPLAMRELAGNVCETLLVQRLFEERPEGDSGEAMLWLMLQRISNLLLTVPARHRLLRAIYSERRNGVIPSARLNELSEESWRHYYGDATLDTDRYVWVHKTHFYRRRTTFYDWQYAFGFLLSQLLAKRWKQTGATASGDTLQTLWLDAGSMTTSDLIHKHFGGDARSVDFWREALEETLWPVEAFRALKAAKNEGVGLRN